MTAFSTRLLATVSLLTCVLLIGHALILGMHFEGTERALRDAATGRAIAYAAVPGAALSLAALAAGRRSFGTVAAILGASAAAIAVAISVLR